MDYYWHTPSPSSRAPKRAQPRFEYLLQSADKYHKLVIDLWVYWCLSIIQFSLILCFKKTNRIALLAYFQLNPDTPTNKRGIASKPMNAITVFYPFVLIQTLPSYTMKE